MVLLNPPLLNHRDGVDFELAPVFQLLETAAYAPEALAGEAGAKIRQNILDLELRLEKQVRRNEGGQDY